LNEKKLEDREVWKVEKEKTISKKVKGEVLSIRCPFNQIIQVVLFFFVEWRWREMNLCSDLNLSFESFSVFFQCRRWIFCVEVNTIRNTSRLQEKFEVSISSSLKWFDSNSQKQKFDRRSCTKITVNLHHCKLKISPTIHVQTSNKAKQIEEKERDFFWHFLKFITKRSITSDVFPVHDACPNNSYK
jgi:hypothetical protein